MELLGLGMLAIASILGMLWRFGEKFMPAGEIVKIISNVVVAVVLVVLAFGVIFNAITLGMITGIAWLGFIFYLGIGYAAANLIADLIGM